MSNSTEHLTLTDFLLARIAEDETVARAADGSIWASGDGDVSEGGLYAYSPGSTEDRDCWSIAWFELGETNPDQGIAGQNWRRHPHANSVHASVHDPARVLAECAAKRAIVENAESERQRMAIYNRAHLAGDLTTPGDLRARLDANVRWGTLHNVLRAMAGVYRDHPDCDASWEVWP